jgi:hypothetical protein
MFFCFSPLTQPLHIPDKETKQINKSKKREKKIQDFTVEEYFTVKESVITNLSSSSSRCAIFFSGEIM